MLTPRNYQVDVINRGIERNTLLGLQMGLGKSLCGIEIAKAVFQQYNAACLVICPKGLKFQWQGFILAQDPTANIFIVDNEPFGLLDRIKNADYVVIHYEGLLKHIDIFIRYTFSTIIVDECHRIKNRKAQRTLAVKSLKGVRKLALSGTPFDKNPAELWSVLNWLDKRAFSSYWKFFESQIAFDTDYFGYRKNFRVKDPVKFAEMLKPHAVFLKKSQVLPELPPLQFTTVPIELSPAQRKAYDTIKKARNLEAEFAELDEPMLIRNALSRLSKLLQCASDPAGLNLVAPSSKLEWLKEWIDDHSSEPVLVFSRYRKTAERAAQLIGADALVMGGSPPTSPLTNSQRIVATIAAAGEGFDLGHISTAIYLDCEWSSILMSQSQERIDRGGNTEPKQIIFLQAIDTVDQLVADALQFKWDQKQLIDQFLQSENAQTTVVQIG